VKPPKMPDEYWRETRAKLPPEMEPLIGIAESAFYMGVCATMEFMMSLQSNYQTNDDRAAAFMMFDRRIDEIKEEHRRKRQDAERTGIN
jgi:hypothetical protein